MLRRYIDAIEAETAIKNLFADMPRIEFNGNQRRWREENEQYLQCLDAIKSVPTADVVERKVGKWIDTGSGEECSICCEIQYRYDSFRRFCPNCGAKMEADDGKVC